MTQDSAPSSVAKYATLIPMKEKAAITATVSGFRNPGRSSNTRSSRTTLLLVLGANFSRERRKFSQLNLC